MKRTLLSLLTMTGLACAGADFDAGNKAYDEGKFLEARRHYEAQVARGEWTANLFFNLGNANERVGAPGLAMLNYERAVALQPNHHEALANLNFLREQSRSKAPALDWRVRGFGILSFDGWIIAASLLAWLALYIMIVPLARRRRLQAQSVFWFVLVLCSAGWAGVGAWQTSGELNAGVVVVKQVEVRQAPTERAALADLLPAGSRVRVISVRGEWTYCELPDGVRGWVSSPSVERIRLL